MGKKKTNRTSKPKKKAEELMTDEVLMRTPEPLKNPRGIVEHFEIERVIKRPFIFAPSGIEVSIYKIRIENVTIGYIADVISDLDNIMS